MASYRGTKELALVNVVDIHLVLDTLAELFRVVVG